MAPPIPKRAREDPAGYVGTVAPTTLLRTLNGLIALKDTHALVLARAAQSHTDPAVQRAVERILVPEEPTTSLVHTLIHRLTSAEKATLAHLIHRDRDALMTALNPPAPPPPRPFAYVCLVMGGDSYIPGALVTGWSIACSEDPKDRKADRVVMVTPDVSAEGRAQLAQVFDQVKEVPLLEGPVVPMATQKQEGYYGHWMSRAATKWRCMAFTEYKKVLFLDADLVVTRSLESLFELQAPAGTFSNPWARPYGSMNNPYLGPRGQTPRHGDRISWETVEKGLVMKGGFVAIGTTVLLEPNVSDLALLERLFHNQGNPFGYPQCNSGKDEQALALLTVKTQQDWTMIDQRFNFIPWRGTWLATLPAGERTPFLFHYFNVKPWAQSRASYPDLALWWQVAEGLVGAKPTLEKVFPPDLFVPGPEEGTCFWCKVHAPGHDHHLTFDPKEERVVCPLLKN